MATSRNSRGLGKGIGKSTSKGLGKGLDALISTEGIPEDTKDSVVELKINDISPNTDQPRKVFDDDALNELAASIKENGVTVIVENEAGHGFINQAQTGSIRIEKTSMKVPFRNSQIPLRKTA